MNQLLFNDVLARVTRMRVISIALLFLLVQSASILHAAEHPFHADEASCEIFHAIEKSKSVAADSANIALFVRFEEQFHPGVDGAVVSTAVHCYHSRAPPAYSLI